MGETHGLRVAVTGAAGFIGRALVERIERGALGSVAQLRLNDVQSFTHPNAVVVPGSFTEAGVRDQLVDDGIDLLFHLASLPGGAAEHDPALGRSVNLDGSIALLDAVAAAGAPRVVYASSIAALQAAGSYGTHKALLEIYLASLTRRAAIDGRAVRPAGIVARPRAAYAGFATAWMSELFHAALARDGLAIPMRADAQVALQSVDTVADNLVHAALLPASALSAQRTWTLPATRVRIDALLDALQRRTGHRPRVDHGEAPSTQPALDDAAALALGFRSDGDADALVDAVVSRLERAQRG